MALIENSTNIVSKNWLRMPVSEISPGTEYFNFTGIATFNKLIGNSSSILRGEALITADYKNIVPVNKAILPKHWTNNVQLASVFKNDGADNVGWAIDESQVLLIKDKNGNSVLLTDGILTLNIQIACRDLNSRIYRIAYNVSIVGKIIDYEPIIFL